MKANSPLIFWRASRRVFWSIEGVLRDGTARKSRHIYNSTMYIFMNGHYGLPDCLLRTCDQIFIFRVVDNSQTFLRSCKRKRKLKRIVISRCNEMERS